MTDSPIIAQTQNSLSLEATSQGRLTLSTDSEWQGSGEFNRQPLTTQVSVVQYPETVDILFYWPLALRARTWDECMADAAQVGAIAVHPDEFTDLTILDWVLNHAEGVGTVEILMFYSPTDLRLLLNTSEMSEMGRKGLLHQKRRITIRTSPMQDGAIRHAGRWFTSIKDCRKETGERGVRVILDDLRGNSPGSLGAMAEAVGVTMSKDILNPLTGKPMPKDDMLNALKANPQDFTRYAVEDARKLHEIRHAFNTKVSRLMADATGVEIPADKIKGTNGAMVADYFERWLMGLHPAMPYAAVRLGMTSLNLTRKQANWQNALQDRVEQNFQLHGFEEYLAIAEGDEDAEGDLKHYLRAKLESTGLQEASSAVLGANKTTLAYSAMVQGGRAVNERPNAYVLERGADIDLQGCYGSALRRFQYPLGLPSTYHYHQRESGMTLGSFMAKHERYMVDNLWTVTVSGGLKFAQDLIFSKRSTIGKISKAATGFDLTEHDLSDAKRVDTEVSQLGGEFALIRKSIENGVITRKVWDTLKTVASDRELKQIKDLRVVSAVWYDRRNRVESVAEWATRTVESEGHKTVKNGDRRFNKWCSVDIGDFMGPLLDLRSAKKKAWKQAEKGSEESTRLNSEQTLLKLFINTLYGCLASPFFRISNAVVANNITAAARVGAWQMAKALGSVQSITDGGAHPLRAVRFMSSKVKLPGLATLSAYEAWNDPRKGRTVGNLGGLDWGGEAWDRLKGMEGNEAERWLGEIGLTHIRSFWERYGLSFDFDVEYKGKNTFERLAYWNKTDYGMLTVNFPRRAEDGSLNVKPLTPVMFTDSDGVEHDVSRMSFKVRGERFDFGRLETVAPKLELLVNILDGSDRVPSRAQWVQTRLMSISDWSKSNYDPEAPFLPGDEVTELRGVSKNSVLYKNHNQPADTFSQYDRRLKRRIGYEKRGCEGLSGMHRAMVRDESP